MKELMIAPDSTVKQAIKGLSKAGMKCLMVANENKILLGTLSDGDLRRAILKGAVISDSIKDMYQSKPTFFVEGQYKTEQAKKYFLEESLTLSQ